MPKRTRPLGCKDAVFELTSHSCFYPQLPKDQEAVIMGPVRVGWSPTGRDILPIWLWQMIGVSFVTKRTRVRMAAPGFAAIGDMFGRRRSWKECYIAPSHCVSRRCAVCLRRTRVVYVYIYPSMALPQQGRWNKSRRVCRALGAVVVPQAPRSGSPHESGRLSSAAREF